MRKEIIKQIRSWVKDFQKTEIDAGLSLDADDETFEGSAYGLFMEILAEQRKENEENKKFDRWEKEHQEELVAGYLNYLREAVLEDENWDLTTTEDYWTWAREECEIEKERKPERKE